jgi:prephenate dehydratase
MSAGHRTMTRAAATVAYHGLPGANGEAAILARWRVGARPVPVRTLDALTRAVADRGVDFGVVPVWNSTIGTVHEGCAALAAHGARLAPAGDVTIEVRHALLALRGTTLQDVRVVGSHAAALAQCGRWIARQAGVRTVTAWSTAGAAHDLASLARGDDTDDAPWWATVPECTPQSLAVIANATLAERHGLAVLAEDIHDERSNATRFAVVRSREAAWGW